MPRAWQLAMGLIVLIPILSGSTSAEELPPAEVLAELAKFQANASNTAENLKTFDTLDFEVYSHQQWERLGESHAANIVVHYPDGHATTGLDAHIQELTYIFTFAPDTNISEHRVEFGSNGWTGVIGVLRGSFTKPMKTAQGELPPNGKSFELTMSTIGHWTEAGVMDEEWIFWDNQSFMKQLGLAP